ncbi:MAG: helix-turn-helix domain-containing protein [Lachnospiraceae bacterium]|nr:helix-turn-helix domain-containing protein [Lachnospiraceae bacterium]
MDRKLLGKRIREERVRIGLTQEQIAESINVSTTYIGFIERGERSVTLEKLILLAECFHVPIDSLLHEIPDDGPQAKENQLQSVWSRASNDDKDLILSIAEVIVSKSQNN